MRFTNFTVAALHALGLGACSVRYEYDGSGLAWNDPTFLADGRIGLVQSAWDTYAGEGCGYFGGSTCYERRNQRAHLIAFSPNSGTLDTLLAFSETPRFIYAAPRAVFDFTDSVLILNLVAAERRTIRVDYDVHGFFYATFSRSGQYLADGKLRMHAATGVLDRPLPTHGPFKDLEFGYYDDVAGKAILTRDSIWPGHTSGKPPRPRASMLYDFATGSLDSSRRWLHPGAPVSRGTHLALGPLGWDGRARRYAVTPRNELDLAAPAYDTIHVVASEYYVDLDLDARKTVGERRVSGGNASEIFVGDFDGNETVYRARDYHPGYPPAGSWPY